MMNNWVSIIILLSSIASGISAPSSLTIGGLFNPLTKNNQFSLVQAEHLAAFVMAIREINNKTDGQWDDLLPNTELKIDLEIGNFDYQAPALAAVKLRTSGAIGAVCALPNLETIAFNTMAREPKMVSINSIASSISLGQADEFPYSSEVSPLDSFSSMVFQSLACAVKAHKVVIITSSDFIGTRASRELQDGVYCPISVLGTIVVKAHEFDMQYVIDQIKELGGTVIALYTPPEYSAAILEQGYAAGLFVQDTIFFSLDNDIIPHFSPNTDVAAVMTGYFGVEYWPKFSFGRTPMAIDFARRWSAQASTAGVGGSCDTTKDDEGSTYLYRSQTNASLCTGLDFSSYPVDGSTIADDTALTYEATLVLAHALHVAIEAGKDYMDGDILQQIIIDDVRFQGVTGVVDVYAGMSFDEYYGRGGREVGLFFKVVNFQAWAYHLGMKPFIQVNAWSADYGSLIGCTFAGCNYPAFKTSGPDKALPPSDTFPDIFVHMPMTQRIILFVCAAIAGVVVTLFAIFTLRNVKHRVIKAAQPALLYTTLFGTALGTARIIVAAIDQSDVTCNLQNWFGHLAFGIVFSSMFVKTYRVHILVNSHSLRRSKFTTKYALIHLAAVVVLFSCMLIILSVVGKPYLGHIITLKSNQYTKVEVCKMENPEVQTAIFTLEFAMMLGGLYLCYLIRNVYSSVNESKLVAAAMVVIVLIAAIVLFIRMPPVLNSFIASIVFAAGIVLVLVILFIPKMQQMSPKTKGQARAHLPSSRHHHHRSEDLDGDVEKAAAPVVAAVGKTGSASNLKQNKRHHGHKEREKEDSDGSSAVVDCASALKDLSLSDKISFCNNQILKWQARQMTLLSGEPNSSKSNSSSNYSIDAASVGRTIYADDPTSTQVKSLGGSSNKLTATGSSMGMGIKKTSKIFAINSPEPEGASISRVIKIDPEDHFEQTSMEQHLPPKFATKATPMPETSTTTAIAGGATSAAVVPSTVSGSAAQYLQNSRPNSAMSVDAGVKHDQYINDSLAVDELAELESFKFTESVKKSAWSLA